MAGMLILAFALCSVNLVHAQTWGTQNSTITNNVNGVCFMKNTNTGYITASGGRILKTTNGGITWTLQNSGNVNNLYAIYFTGMDTGYAVGDSGTILATKDGGSNWTAISSGTTERLNDIHVMGGTGYAVGDNGVILKVNGFTVTSSNSGTSSNLQAVRMMNTTTAVVVGGGLLNSVILATYNSGNVWVPISSGSVNQLNDIYFINDSTGYVVGNNGTILRTTNYGANWSSMTTGTTSNLNALYFINDTTGYVAGASGTVLKTQNGTSWTRMTNVGTTANLNDITFSDEYTGYAGGNNGTVIKTCPYAFFTASTAPDLCVNTSVTFTNGSHNASSYTWTVNSDTVSTSTNYTQTFDTSRVFDVWLIADNGTCTSIFSRAMHVEDTPSVNLGNDTTICNSCTITLNAGNPGATYKWYKDGVATGVVSRTTTVGVAGTYKVEVTSPGGCVGMDSIKVNMVTSIASINNDEAQLTVFPNPNNKQFTLEFMATQPTEISITNAIGQVVYHESVSQNGKYSKSISLQDFAAGIYLVQVSSKGHSSAVRMITY